MSDQVLTTLIIAFFASLAPTIAAFAALIVSRGTDKKTDGLIHTTTEIHTLTNSNLAAVTGALAVALEKISGMERMIATLNLPPPIPATAGTVSPPPPLAPPVAEAVQGAMAAQEDVAAPKK